MKVLFISGELIGADVCHRLKKEGCEVKLFIADESRKDCFEGIVEKVDDWTTELGWVGKDGLIVFDDVGYGKVQDDLRQRGYNVVGGSEGGDKLELDREFGQKIFSECGIKVVASRNFSNIEDAIEFVKENKGEWVIKQDGHLSFLNYVGLLESGEDVISVLESYRKYEDQIECINLQKKIKGIEMGIARYFNGNDWIGPIEFNVEHKDLHNDNIGPKTGEMGTLMWLENDENNKLYSETLAKLKPYLKKSNFKGDIDLNFIINDEGAFPLEATMRFGCPAIQLQSELFISPWSEFLMAVAKGEDYKLEYKKEYGIIVSIAIPPFPYKSISNAFYLSGTKILFSKELTKEELSRLHFEEVSCDCDGRYCVAGSNGYIMYVSGSGNSISDARKCSYDLVKKIIIPKMFFRTDIGSLFEKKQIHKLNELGWINNRI